MSAAIQVTDLGKRYHVPPAPSSTQPYERLTESIDTAIKEPLKWLKRSISGRPSASSSHDEFWALRDVSFEVHPGEVLGIIGRNGAGKSTLLKILSRVTEPTTGRITLNGRIASLLEVGTGFHPELTGRENIFLNGAILGMSRAEIRSKFDEIVDFAGVEKFLDTPVKRYSSGMSVRLAFAVAAHLEPEILIIDEVLAVGDAEFQKKCLGRISDVARSGRTVLFVSHQMNAIRSLCSRALLLESGREAYNGPPQEAINRYLGDQSPHYSEWLSQPSFRVDDPAFSIKRFALVDSTLRPILGPIQADQSLGILIEADVQKPDSLLTFGFTVHTHQGELLWWTAQIDTPEADWPKIIPGHNRFVAWMPAHLLNEGSYRCDLMVSIHWQRWISQPLVNAPSLPFQIRGGLSASPLWREARPGLLAPIIPIQPLR